MLDYGETIEEVYTSLAKAKIYDPQTAETEFMKREIPDVKSIFHKLDYQNFFKTTIQRRDLERAFLSEDGVYNLVSDIISSLYSGMEYDEFITMKQLIVEYAKKGLFYEVEIPTVTADNMKSIISTVKGYSNKLTFMSTQYNAMGVPTYTDRSSQIIFIDAEFDAMMDVEVLASAFNMDKAEFMGRRILIDNFGELTGAKLLLCDESFSRFTMCFSSLKMFAIRKDCIGTTSFISGQYFLFLVLQMRFCLPFQIMRLQELH